MIFKGTYYLTKYNEALFSKVFIQCKENNFNNKVIDDLNALCDQIFDDLNKETTKKDILVLYQAWASMNKLNVYLE